MGTSHTDVVDQGFIQHINPNTFCVILKLPAILSAMLQLARSENVLWQAGNLDPFHVRALHFALESLCGTDCVQVCVGLDALCLNDLELEAPAASPTLRVGPNHTGAHNFHMLPQKNLINNPSQYSKTILESISFV